MLGLPLKGINNLGDNIEIRTNIFIGNLSYNVAEADLRYAFEGFGQVVSVTVLKDKQSGR